MYMTRPSRPSKIISMLGSAEPSWSCTAGGIAKRMFIAPGLALPSNMPFPLKRTIPPDTALTDRRGEREARRRCLRRRARGLRDRVEREGVAAGTADERRGADDETEQDKRTRRGSHPR